MLAIQQRRQQLPRHSNTSFSSPLTSQNFNLDQLSQQLLHDYLESQQQAYIDPAVVDADLPTAHTPFMTSAYDFANPAIRIQQSTPTPQLPSSFAHTSVLPPTTATSMDNWNTYSNTVQTNGGQSLQTPRSGRAHQRASSSSSIGSSGSQYQTVGPNPGYPADEPSRAFSNHLPTPTHTPTHDSFMSSNNYNTFTPNTSGMEAAMAPAHFSMKQALMDQNGVDDDVPGFGHSARHSVSSYGHDSPATPHTAPGDDFEDRFKVPPTDMRQHTVPKFERTYTDVAADNFYDPAAMLSQPQSTHAKPANAALLSPFRSSPNDIVQRTLQAAQNARSQSPSSSSVSRGVSPFRQNSPFRQPSTGFNSPRVRVGTAAQAREQNIEADAAYAMKQNVPSSEEAQPKTISPKDALLDYRDADEDSKVSLFPESGATEYANQYNGGDQYRNATQSSFDDTTSGQSYRRDSWATPQFSSNFSTAPPVSSQPASSFAFAPPSISGNLHGLPFTSSASQYRSASNTMPTAQEPVPDFPAHLTSMESSASEAELQNSQASGENLLKPASSAADGGTYTCTYHGCTQRFETPQKLQKHKREGHRSTNANIGSSMTSAALLERNSQAGPHKCERINPTTGKPCNTIFSRPYDLTRHEDTIHNARKQKVRCALCVEEKTFSRNDALTRHMRVVHPEIDFPGKHRRRGGNHD